MIILRFPYHQTLFACKFLVKSFLSFGETSGKRILMNRANTYYNSDKLLKDKFHEFHFMSELFLAHL